MGRCHACLNELETTSQYPLQMSREVSMTSKYKACYHYNPGEENPNKLFIIIIPRLHL